MSLAPSFQTQSLRDREGFNSSGTNALDSIEAHSLDTEKAGAQLASRTAIRRLCAASPAMLEWLAALGVPFTRQPGGSLATVRLSGSSRQRTAFAEASTGRHLVASLDALVRTQQEVHATDEYGVGVAGERLVRRTDYWRFVAPVLSDHGVVVGVLAQDLRTLAFKAFPADGVIVASGDFAGLFDGAACSPSSTGAALGSLLAHGAVLSNLEFLQQHPLVAVNGPATVALPELLRAHGARLGSTKGKDPDGSKELDLTTLSPDVAARLVASLGPALEQALGVDLLRESVRVQSRPLRTLGGLWVDEETSSDPVSPRQHSTNLPGLYAAGGASAQYHGAGSLPGNLAPADILGGQLAACGVLGFRGALDKSAFDLPKSIFDKAATKAESEFEALVRREPQKDSPTPHAWLAQLKKQLTKSCSSTRDADGLDDVGETLNHLHEQLNRVSVSGPTTGWNQEALLASSLADILTLARAAVASIAWREESRGTHQRSDFKDTSEAFARASLVRSDSDREAATLDSFDYVCAGNSITFTP